MSEAAATALGLGLALLGGLIFVILYVAHIYGVF